VGAPAHGMGCSPSDCQQAVLENVSRIPRRLRTINLDGGQLDIRLEAAPISARLTPCNSSWAMSECFETKHLAVMRFGGSHVPSALLRDRPSPKGPASAPASPTLRSKRPLAQQTPFRAIGCCAVEAHVAAAFYCLAAVQPMLASPTLEDIGITINKCIWGSWLAILSSKSDRAPVVWVQGRSHIASLRKTGGSLFLLQPAVLTASSQPPESISDGMTA
jgi:hypothetical protein